MEKIHKSHSSAVQAAHIYGVINRKLDTNYRAVVSWKQDEINLIREF